MAGAILMVIVLVLVIPVAVCMSGAVVAALLGWSLKEDAEARNEGSELIDLNK
jgi:membrane glycosyltransferase